MANERARRLRRNSTEAERRLWYRLRVLKAKGLHFRRQVPIDRYIVDFACFANRLVIELDGGQHGFAAMLEADRVRDRYLRGQGFTVLRFWNNDVMSNVDGVMQVVVDVLHGAPPPPRAPSRCSDARPSPQGGG